MEYPVWLSIVLGLAMSIALAGLGGWLLFTSLTKAINAALKLESKRTDKETDALNNWKTAYEAEHKDHINDVSELLSQLNDERYLNAENMKEADKQIKELLRQIKEKDALLRRTRVVDL